MRNLCRMLVALLLLNILKIASSHQHIDFKEINYLTQAISLL
jgi:hypothetical protein